MEQPKFIIDSANKLVYLSVRSDKTTGEQWIARLENQGFKISAKAKWLLLSPYFSPTGNINYDSTVIKGEKWSDGHRNSFVFIQEAAHLKLCFLRLEAACLIREALSDDDLLQLDLNWLVVMHPPVKTPYGNLVLIIGCGVIDVVDFSIDSMWGLKTGFVVCSIR